jgi:RimJ/RimL family protein N-acetyltransferase
VELRVEPVVLEGEVARLEPLSLKHAPDIAKHADPELFKFFGAVRPEEKTLHDTEIYIKAMVALPDVLPFAIIDRASGEAVGVTTYMDIRPKHLGLEIGMTWVSPEHQRTRLNTECKLLLLTHAFEVLGCVRVQLKTDARNIQSQTAIERIGGKKEGVLRKHVVMYDGFVRDTVMYSIISSEWPEVKIGLLERLTQRAGARVTSP